MGKVLLTMGWPSWQSFAIAGSIIVICIFAWIRPIRKKAKIQKAKGEQELLDKLNNQNPWFT